MPSFSELFSEEYNTQRDQWEKALKLELKLDDVTSKLSKKNPELGSWPTLSLKATPLSLSTKNSWKKAAQTYVQETHQLQEKLREDLEAGVRVFFFYFPLSAKDWSSIEALFGAHPDAKDIEVVALNSRLSVTKKILVIDQTSICHARDLHDQGAHNIQELAVLTLRLIESLKQPPTHLGICVDSHFFKNIAKVRALKLLASKVAQEADVADQFKIVALNSYREWTLYERYSNMLRNDAQVASAYIAGADLVQSSGYQTLFELETNESSEHGERSHRMARNTTHILGLESMLGIVEDAAHGSFHLETLTQIYAEKAWALMQQLLPMKTAERESFLQQEVRNVREQRLERVKTRKDVLAGMNDFPDGREKLNVTLKEPVVFRVARCFEELRLHVESLKNPPKVQIILRGDYAALNNRINFIKNYFEVIGLEVLDPMVKIKLDQRILVLCGKDEEYAELAAQTDKTGAHACYVAGKVDVPGYEPIFMGQNVYETLSQLMKKLSH